MIRCKICILKIILLKSIILIKILRWLHFLGCILIIVVWILCLLLKCWTSLKTWLEVKLWLPRLVYLTILGAALFILNDVVIQCWLLILCLKVVAFLNKWSLILWISSKWHRVSCKTILISIFFLSLIILKAKTHFLTLILHSA